MWYLAPGKISENMIQLNRFCLYFEIILNRTYSYFHIEIVISATEMVVVRGLVPQEKLND